MLHLTLSTEARDEIDRLDAKTQIQQAYDNQVRMKLELDAELSGKSLDDTVAADSHTSKPKADALEELQKWKALEMQKREELQKLLNELKESKRTGECCFSKAKQVPRCVGVPWGLACTCTCCL
jgi:hypothetical protein